MAEVRVMTYNIYMGGRKGRALHQLIRQVAPDVLLVNESPKWPIVWRRQCHKLATRWGMRFVGGGRKAGSNMITVGRNVRVKSVRTEVFDTPFLKPRRGVVAAQLRTNGTLFGAIACHLSLEKQARAKEVERLIEIANQLRGPVIIGGDLNERPDGRSWQTLREAGFADHGNQDWKTFLADNPTARIDALLVRGNAQVLHHGDPGAPIDLQKRASDHRGVLAVIDF